MRLFGIYIVIEIVLLLIAGRVLGIGLTLFIMLATAVLGILVLRLAGLSTLLGIRQKIVSGESPNSEMMNGLLLGAGGFLLLLPGLLGDVIGALLIIPSTRTLFIQSAKKLLRYYGVQKQPYAGDFRQGFEKKENDGNIIEGEWQKKDE